MTTHKIKQKWYDWSMTIRPSLNSKKRGGVPHSGKIRQGSFYIFGTMSQSLKKE